MNTLTTLQARVAELRDEGMDFDSALRAAAYELRRTVEDHKTQVPECDIGCDDPNCPYIH